MIDIQDISNSDYYEPCYYSHFHNPTSYRICGIGYLPGYEPHSSKSLFRTRSISYGPRNRSSLSRSKDSVYELPKYSFLSKRGTGYYGPQDYSYGSDASCYRPRGYSYISGSGTSYYEPCGYGCRSCDEPCGFDPIPVGRSGYAYRRRYSCRPISGEPSCYGSRTYYPPSYWMEQNKYYGPC